MRFLALIPALLLASPAIAAPWVIDPASTLTFTGKQAGDAFTGSFTRFTPVVEFDPHHPERGKITVTVDMTQIALADKDKRESLPEEAWFFTQQFPTATFISTAIRRHEADAHRFVAEGNLTIRGITKPISLHFFLEEKAPLTVADGTVTLNRKDFGIGQGEFSDDQWIAYPVAVKFHLIATKPTARKKD